jgi:L-aminopeptidase/D-esterase-like protein
LNLKRLWVLLAAAVLVLPASAAAQDTKVDFDKAFDFSTIKTYAIRIGTGWGNDLSERRVLAEFDQALTAKGWKKAPEAQADAHVILHGATAQKHSATTFYSGMGGYGYRGYGGGMGTASTMVSEYTVGTLVVDIFDGKSKNLVFRGTAEDELSDNPEKNKKKLEKASAKIFKNFPPTPKAK